ncbi:MAG: UDP-glucose--hexose-1-phosphate uridylyltransferase [Ruminococcaceae bacterium]|nr:UDP-glucose--hexose-1-phosphate uridylyltransferase [Oscillospiraceae bacterium]
MIFPYINSLVNYAMKYNLIETSDKYYVINTLLDILNLDEYIETEECPDLSLEEILGKILDFAVENELIDDNITERDLFDTRVMSALTPRPSEVINKFNALYAESPEKATDYFYKLSCDCDYIRRYRIKKDMKWVYPCEYGNLDITINLSKPEKDPKAIAAAKNAKQSSYPKCMLCRENTGYRGRLNYPARQTLRTVPVLLDGVESSMQYSPYVYYNEHCIVFNNEHTPMKIDKKAFAKLLDFVSVFPHYFIGSNADLPIVGGSILSHDHFQGGHYTFAMAEAPIEKEFVFDGFEDVSAGIVKWPMSVIRLNGKNKEKLVELSDKILTAWRAYTDEDAFVFAETDGVPHNTITPIARRRGEKFEMDLVLRNNITTDEHPLGVYHPHSELHHIKKENIGLIEVMGLAVLPSRLKTELAILEECLVKGEDVSKNEKIAIHADWADEIKGKYDLITEENVHEIVLKETGLVFKTVLEHAGVYKVTEEGRNAFMRFLESVK